MGYVLSGKKMTLASYLYQAIIYLAITVALIGCQPPDTCYYDASDSSQSARVAAKSWIRMQSVRSRNKQA